MAAEANTAGTTPPVSYCPELPALEHQAALVLGEDDVRVLAAAIAAAVDADQAFASDASSSRRPSASQEAAVSRVVGLYAEAARLLTFIGASKTEQRVSATFVRPCAATRPPNSPWHHQPRLPASVCATGAKLWPCV